MEERDKSTVSSCQPSSTYRLQLRSGVTLQRLRALVGYFQELGISNLYLSPILKADSRSPHGYAVVDFNDLDPRIGSVEELAELAQELRRRKMGILLDFVSNHMSAAAADNRWWRDVLELGPRSTFSPFFDIDWYPSDPELQGKVLLPVLGERYDEALAGSLSLTRSLEGIFVAYGELRFPLAPESWLATLTGEDDGEVAVALTEIDALLRDGKGPLQPFAWREKERLKTAALATIYRSKERLLRWDERLRELSRSPEELDDLLRRQHYLLRHFEEASERINYRRFFDINDLVAISVENAAVFAETHGFLFALMDQNWVAGVRIDHIDGLQDPESYLKRFPSDRYLIVEKILARHERLPPEWPVAGTSGYEILNRLQRLFVDPEGGRALDAFFREQTGAGRSFEDAVYQSKLDVIDASFRCELTRLATRLLPLVRKTPLFDNEPPESVREALRALIAGFPIYRTYFRPGDETMTDRDRRVLSSAGSVAKRHCPGQEGLVDLLTSLLARPPLPEITLSFQQITSPVTAKGVEDTAFYRYFPLASLNEVGGGPMDVEDAVDEFHQRNRERALRSPYGLTATSTHDTKRDEDVRSRIHVLSEVTREWREAVQRWRDGNRRHKRSFPSGEAPDAAEEYLFYQTLLGTWPLEPLDAVTHRGYVERLVQYMVKALREAKRHTGWLAPDQAYEGAVSDFVRKLLDPTVSLRFLDDFSSFETEVRDAGLLNALSQTILKCTIPGVPDFYQGTEIWKLRLVDPDNRGPVDFDKRRDLLRGVLEEIRCEGEVGFLARALSNLSDGRLKLYLTWRLLHARLERPEVFGRGDYLPLDVRGPRKAHVVAFARSADGQQAIIATARFYTPLLPVPIDESTWEETVVALPDREAKHSYREILSGRIVRSNEERELLLSDAFRDAPFAVLLSHEADGASQTSEARRGEP